MKFLIRLASLIFILGGGILVVYAAAPIVGYELFEAPRFKKDQLLSPVGKTTSLVQEARDYRPVDLTKASNWFVGTGQEAVFPSKIKYYNVSVPKLGIRGATVEIGGEDLSENLIHYRGTGLPGRPGNSVIFGHSILPQFFNPENYLAIFSTLPTLSEGDKILVDYDGITYTYKVEELFEVEPADVQVLEQKYDDSYLSLITCVPPGTYLRRLVVKSRLMPPQDF